MSNRDVLGRVAEIYGWLDSQIEDNSESQGKCGECGRCCDFDIYGHRLFVTRPELMYLEAALGGELKPMPGGRCPYNVNGKCTVYEDRFAGCRIFGCKGDADFQSGLSESAVGKFKSICVEFEIDYLYADLATALGG